LVNGNTELSRADELGRSPVFSGADDRGGVSPDHAPSRTMKKSIVAFLLVVAILIAMYFIGAYV
jgi:hypothetical protein